MHRQTGKLNAFDFSSVRTRLFWSLSIFFAAFAGFLALSIPNCDLWQPRFLHMIILLVVLTNVGVNVLQVR